MVIYNGRRITHPPSRTYHRENVSAKRPLQRKRIIDLTDYSLPNFDERRDDGPETCRSPPSRSLRSAPRIRQRPHAKQSNHSTTAAATRRQPQGRTPKRRLFIDTRHIQDTKINTHKDESHDVMSAFFYEFQRHQNSKTWDDEQSERMMICMDDIMSSKETTRVPNNSTKSPSPVLPTSCNNYDNNNSVSIDSIRRAAKLLQMKYQVVLPKPVQKAAESTGGSSSANHSIQSTQSSLVTVEAIRRAAQIIREASTSKRRVDRNVTQQSNNNESSTTGDTIVRTPMKKTSTSKCSIGTGAADVGRMLLSQNASFMRHHHHKVATTTSPTPIVAPKDTSGVVERLHTMSIRGSGAESTVPVVSPPVCSETTTGETPKHVPLGVRAKVILDQKRGSPSVESRAAHFISSAVQANAEHGGEGTAVPFQSAVGTNPLQSRNASPTTNLMVCSAPIQMSQIVVEPSSRVLTTSSQQLECDCIQESGHTASCLIPSAIRSRSTIDEASLLKNLQPIKEAVPNLVLKIPKPLKSEYEVNQGGESLLDIDPSKHRVASPKSASSCETEEDELFALIDLQDSIVLMMSPTAAEELQNQVDEAFEFDFISQRSSMRISPPAQAFESQPVEECREPDGLNKTTKDAKILDNCNLLKSTKAQQSIDIAPRIRERMYDVFLDDDDDLDKDAQSTEVAADYRLNLVFSDDESSADDSSSTESGMGSDDFDSDSMYSDLEAQPDLYDSCTGAPFAANIYDATCTWLEEREGPQLCISRLQLCQKSRGNGDILTGKSMRKKLRQNGRRIPKSITTLQRSRAYSKYLENSRCKAVKKVRTRDTGYERLPGEAAVLPGVKVKKSKGSKKKKKKSRKADVNKLMSREIKESALKIETAIVTAAVSDTLQTHRIRDQAESVAPEPSQSDMGDGKSVHENTGEEAQTINNETNKIPENRKLTARRIVAHESRRDASNMTGGGLSLSRQEVAANPLSAHSPKIPNDRKEDQAGENGGAKRRPMGPHSASLERLRKKGVPNRKYIRALSPAVNTSPERKAGPSKSDDSKHPEHRTTSQNKLRETRCKTWKRRKDQLPKRSFRSS